MFDQPRAPLHQWSDASRIVEFYSSSSWPCVSFQSLTRRRFSANVQYDLTHAGDSTNNAYSSVTQAQRTLHSVTMHHFCIGAGYLFFRFTVSPMQHVLHCRADDRPFRKNELTRHQRKPRLPRNTRISLLLQHSLHNAEMPSSRDAWWRNAPSTGGA